MYRATTVLLVCYLIITHCITSVCLMCFGITSKTIDPVSSGDVGTWTVFDVTKSFWALDVLLKDPVFNRSLNWWKKQWKIRYDEFWQADACSTARVKFCRVHIGWSFSSPVLFGELWSWKCSDFRLPHQVFVLYRAQFKVTCYEIAEQLVFSFASKVKHCQYVPQGVTSRLITSEN